MSFPHPTREEEAQLGTKCPICMAGVDEWCRNDLDGGGIRPMLHRAREAQPQSGARPKSGAKASGAKAEVLGPVCKTCRHEAAYAVRDDDRLAYACPLHLFSTIAAYLISTPGEVVISLVKPLKTKQRRELVERVS
jgi:hypothetical protein